jgi:sterol 3beta-glucosyltransferase
MNIALIGFGSRGDVQPFLALALALREHGHTVTLTAPNDCETQITAYGIDYIPIPHSFKAILEINVFEQVRREGFNLPAIAATVRYGAAKMKRLFQDTMRVAAEAARNADIIVCHGLVSALAYTFHQQFRIPIISGVALPSYPTGAFPNPFFPPVPIGQRFYNPLTHKLIMRVIMPYMLDAMNDYRRQVGLPILSLKQTLDIIFSEQIPLVMHYSRHLVPVPSDWGAHIHVVGTWSLPEHPNWTPPDKLHTFLAQGDPPVFIGFGSMIVPNPAKLVQRIGDALRIAGLRGVLQAGWSGLAHEDDHLITIGETPHDWLFPRMAAVVHHGGSGTTHTTLRAGKPALIVPFYADQPFWGRRVADLGVGVPPIAPRRLTAECLAAALHTLAQDGNLRRRAEEVGALLRVEDGLGTTCTLVEQSLQMRKQGRG